MIKKYIVLISVLSFQLKIIAQVNIGQNTFVKTSGNVYIVNRDLNFINNGTFDDVSGTVKFIGATSSVSGTGALTFYQLDVAKSTNGSLTLSKNISASKHVQFISGLINLNTYNITLLSGAVLLNENEASRIVGANGGHVLTIVNLNAPTSTNPGNLGAIISSSQNLGSVTIQRGHQAQGNVGGGNSVARYFNIQPVNNSSLNATLRFKYFDAELNGNTESSLNLFKSIDNTNWSNQGATSRNVSENYVEKTGINDFSAWVLRSAIPLCDFVFYRDADGDGYGDLFNSLTGCEAPVGYIANNSDCDDTNASVHPRAAEICGNLIDDNCNDQTDEDCTASDPSITINDITVNESQGTGQLTVSLSAPSANTIRVSFRTVNGTASHPKDYTRNTGEVVFPPGSTTQTINIAIIADNKAEPDEYFDVQLHTPVGGATISDNNGRVTITESLLTRINTSISKIRETMNKDHFDVRVSNNPTHSQFRLDIETNKEELVTIQISDVQGKIIQQIQARHPLQPIYLGTDYRSGVYFAQVIQGTTRKTVKLIKF